MHLTAIRSLLLVLFVTSCSVGEGPLRARDFAFAILVMLTLAACTGGHGIAADASIADALHSDDAAVPDAQPPAPRNPPTGEGFVQFGLSAFGGCGLKADGSLRCWGHPARSCQEAEENALTDLSRPLACPPAGAFTELVVGGQSVCGVQADKRTLCSIPKRMFTDSGLIDAFFSSVSGGRRHVCGVQLDGQILCNLGMSKVPDGAFIDVGAGGMNDCAVRTDKTLVCWHPLEYGALPVPEGTFTNVVTQHGPTSDFAGAGACALRTDGTVACFNEIGPAPAPQDVFVQLVAGTEHYCGRRADGSLRCWGKGVNNTPCGNTDGYAPVFQNNCGQAAPPANSFVSIAAANNYSCGLKADGDLQCWGHLPWDRCASENSEGSTCP